MTLLYVHVVCAFCALLACFLAAWGGLTLIVAQRTHGNVRLPFRFRKTLHVRLGILGVGLLLGTLGLGFVMAGGLSSRSELGEMHEHVGLAVVVVFALAALVGLGLMRLQGKKPTLRMLHVLLNVGGGVLFATQVILGLVMLSRFW